MQGLTPYTPAQEESRTIYVMAEVNNVRESSLPPASCDCSRRLL